MINVSEVFSNALNSGNAQYLLLILSFLGGIIASISPCSLAMLPIVIGYIGGYSNNKTSKIGIQLLSFIIGSALVFTCIGVVCALTGRVFISIAGDYFMLVVASLLLVMGLNLLGVIEIQLPSIINKIPQSNNNSSILYPMLLGATFALAGTPCSTPILAGIMSVATVSSTIGLAILMLFLFSLGQGLILVIAGLFTSIIKGFDKVIGVSELLLKFSGGVLIFASILFFYKTFSQF